jgi:hypothetical protein
MVVSVGSNGGKPMKTDEIEFTRRRVLKGGAAVSSALVVGTGASGTVAAHSRNVGYIRSVPAGTPVVEGTVLTVGNYVETRDIKCEGKGQGNNPPHTVDEYEATDSAGGSWRIYVQNPGGKKGTNPPAEVEVIKVVGDCKANKLQKIQWSHA